mgnify:CR=1 FL=1
MRIVGKPSHPVSYHKNTLGWLPVDSLPALVIQFYRDVFDYNNFTVGHRLEIFDRYYATKDQNRSYGSTYRERMLLDIHKPEVINCEGAG